MEYLGRCEVVEVDEPYVIFGKPEVSMPLIEDDEEVFYGEETVPRNQVMNREFIKEGNLGNIYNFGHYHKVVMDPQDIHERALGKSDEQIKYKEERFKVEPENINSDYSKPGTRWNLH